MAPIATQMSALLRLLVSGEDASKDPLSEPTTLLALEAYFGQEMLASALHLLEATAPPSSTEESSPDYSSPNLAGQAPVVKFRLRETGKSAEEQASFLSVRLYKAQKT